MKCTNHPKIDAVGQCSECGGFYCDVCNDSEEAGILICEKCSMFSALTALNQIKIEVQERQDNREIGEAVNKQKRRRSRLLIIVAIAAILGLAELGWYFSLSPTEIQEFVPSEKTFVTTTVINEGINNYREDHDGKAIPELKYTFHQGHKHSYIFNRYKFNILGFDLDYAYIDIDTSFDYDRNGINDRYRVYMYVSDDKPVFGDYRVI